MRVLVSGATGSLGSQILNRFAGKYELGAISRDSEKIDNLGIDCKGFSLNLVKDNISETLQGFDVFIHCAAFASAHGDKSQFDANVLMIENILPALEKAGIFTIFISSASIFDDMPRNELQTNPTIRPKSFYSKSKYDCEKVILESSYKNWTGLRPRAVIGRGDQTLAPKLNNLIKKKRVIIPGNGKSLLDYTTMSDFLDSVECSIEAQAKGRFYNISSGKPLSFKSMIMEYASKIHGVEKSRNVPLLPLRILSSIAPNQRINHYSLNQITKPMRLDISESIRDLGWSPKQTFSECLEELM